MIEHNLDVVKSADWVVDLGPEGGDGGGRVIVEGSPEHVAKTPESYTGASWRPSSASTDARSMTDPSLWERGARWWQEEFTDGADPEYEEQILPLVDATSKARGACSTWAVARVRSRRRAAAMGVDAVGVDPTWNQITEARRRAGGVAYASRDG